jgi:Fic family protein
MSNPVLMYDKPSQFEPLLPQKRLDELYVIARQIAEASLQLRGKLHPMTASALAGKLRAINSYYSNKIEGQSTHPRNIERSLHKDFSKNPGVAKLQRIALTHIDAEREIESWLLQDPLLPFTAEGIQRIHAALYARLAEKDRTTDEGRIVRPGEWRKEDVEVGRHLPPAHGSIHNFLDRYTEVYAREASWDQMLVAIACAHQRLLWIHPFPDGNGRVARLASHAVIVSRLSGGLWSVSRGLARTREDYYARLEDADEPRRGALDGRGNLTEEGLWRWCRYFLGVCLDQVTFISGLLSLDGMRDRIRALVTFRAQTDKRMRLEATLPLHYLFTAGPLSRGEFQQLTGLGERTARTLLSYLLEIGLVESDSRLGPVRFGLPLDSLQFYFPDLYPEAATRPDES